MYLLRSWLTSFILEDESCEFVESLDVRLLQQLGASNGNTTKSDMTVDMLMLAEIRRLGVEGGNGSLSTVIVTGFGIPSNSGGWPWDF